MESLDDDHGVESIRAYVRGHDDIIVNTYIKKGLSGIVYFGKRKKLNDDVVLKFYYAGPDYDSSEEAVILKKIDHPNILKVFDLKFVKPNSACFLSPLISGGDLQSHIDNRSFSSREALEIISGILNGLTELHANHNLVHRDLKPPNILLDMPKNIPIIADLGAVKKINSSDGFTSESKATLYYLPPESIVDKKYYFQSDIYQVGLILFQLLGGFFPINDETSWLVNRELRMIDGIGGADRKKEKFEEIIKGRIFKGKLANTDTLPEYLDPAFKKVVNRAIHLDSIKRFKNTSEFLNEVHKLLNYYPNYLKSNGELMINHLSGKEYKIYQNVRKEYVIEKRLIGKLWRKDNNHDGQFNSVLSLARHN